MRRPDLKSNVLLIPCLALAVACSDPPAKAPFNGGLSGGDGDSETGDGDDESGDGDEDGPGNGNEFGDGDDTTDAGPVELPPFEGAGQPWTKPAPRATCAEGDKGDDKISGLDGDLRCNLEAVHQVAAPHFLSMAWYKDCAYVNGNDGTTVIKVAADGTPTVTTTLTQVGFRSNWESMKVSPVSGLLVGFESNGAGVSVFDVAGDCANPTFKASITLSGALGHSGNFSPDGTIYYASSLFTAAVYAVDLADPLKPTVLTTDFDGMNTHDLGTGKEGNRGYFTYPGVASDFGQGSVAIMDLSEIQARKPEPKAKLIKRFAWPDGNTTQYAIPLTIRGRDHLLVSDEMGSRSCDNPEKPIWGYARIFDISDEQNPTLVSLIKTEAQDPSTCSTQPAAALPFGVGTHYCNVDRNEDPRVMACGNWDAGLRLYDIRNPWQPKELAYFDTLDGGVPGLARILPEKREIWVATTGIASGAVGAAGVFNVLKYTEGSPLDQVLSD